ncbi:UNVERIFIED_CONTAM: Homeobox-leucine zipper protein ATHB-40 [Sesamum angustifolium]|uniref:Homeobox-leucine zipper protein n=1 Tax=Sesamum angustifolium TaxID=2727405 RepID=A0AAW2NHX7_9LAMI
MNPEEVDDQMVLISQYYPDGIYNQFVPEQGAAANSKPRRRRKKNKGDRGGAGDGVMRKRKLSEEQVAVWFQNRRARWKSKKLEEEYSKLKSEHETAVVEKCRLETELLKLKEQLQEAEKEIQRLSERWDGVSSNSPSSSFSMEAMDPPFLGEFGMEGLGNVFYVPEAEGNYAQGLEWNSFYYM